jgi:hypothetical protein
MLMKAIKGNGKRRTVFAIITAALIIVLVGLNILMTLVGRSRSLYVDLTPEGLYTLSDAMVEECSFLDELTEEDAAQSVRITFCTDPDNLLSTITTRVTYLMALKLHEEYDNFEVETVNVTYNPTAVAKYKTTSLSEINPSDVIISYGDRYRVVGADAFWTVDSNKNYWSYNGEYKLATLMRSVTLANDKLPAAYFVTGHGETVYDPEGGSKDSDAYIFAELLMERGLKIKTIDISKVDAIPRDCALLIINNPKTDFLYDAGRLDEFEYISDIEKIDRYMLSNQGALMVAKDYRVKLPNLEVFLKEWGFEFSDSLLRDEVNGLEDENTTGTFFTGVYNKSEESYAHAIYGDFADLDSAPQMSFVNSGYVKRSFGESSTVGEPGSANNIKRYASFITTANTAKPYAYDHLTGGYTNLSGEAKAYDLAGVTTRVAFDSKTAEYTYSYVFCTNTPNFFSNSVLSNASYSNYDIVSALVNNMSRADIYASIDLGGTSLNSQNFGGKKLISTTLSAEETILYSNDGKEILKINKALTMGIVVAATVVVAAVPVITLIVGAVTVIKRKYL